MKSDCLPPSLNLALRPGDVSRLCLGLAQLRIDCFVCEIFHEQSVSSNKRACLFWKRWPDKTALQFATTFVVKALSEAGLCQDL